MCPHSTRSTYISSLSFRMTSVGFSGKHFCIQIGHTSMQKSLVASMRNDSVLCSDGFTVNGGVPFGGFRGASTHFLDISFACPFKNRTSTTGKLLSKSFQLEAWNEISIRRMTVVIWHQLHTLHLPQDTISVRWLWFWKNTCHHLRIEIRRNFFASALSHYHRYQRVIF